MKSTAKVIVSPMCNITCFEQEKVARIKAELATEEHLLPQLAELYKLLSFFRGAGWPMCSGRGMRESEDSAREILDRRYARGGISREESQRMTKELE